MRVLIQLAIDLEDAFVFAQAEQRGVLPLSIASELAGECEGAAFDAVRWRAGVAMVATGC